MLKTVPKTAVFVESATKILESATKFAESGKVCGTRKQNPQIVSIFHKLQAETACGTVSGIHKL